MMTEKWPPLDPGTRVETLAVENPPTDWVEEAKAARKFGVYGRILGHHDSHGLCYDVQHDDGSEGCYDPRELKVLPTDHPGKDGTPKVGLRCTVCDVDLEPVDVALHAKCGVAEGTPSLDSSDGNLPDPGAEGPLEIASAGFLLLELIRIDFDLDESDAAKAIDREPVAIFVDEPKQTAYSKLKKFLQEMEPVKFYLSWDEEIYPKFLVESRRAL